MNIFYVDRNPILAAHYLCDKHVVKMILESAQLLSTAHHHYDTWTDSMYKPTHRNHPCAKWVRKSGVHYCWLLSHARALCREYTERYGKTHKTQAVIVNHLRTTPLGIPFTAWMDPPQCMPEKYHHYDTISAYRAYYRGEKAYMAKWDHSDEPWWWKDQMGRY